VAKWLTQLVEQTHNFVNLVSNFRTSKLHFTPPQPNFITPTYLFSNQRNTFTTQNCHSSSPAWHFSSARNNFTTPISSFRYPRNHFAILDQNPLPQEKFSQVQEAISLSGDKTSHPQEAISPNKTGFHNTKNLSQLHRFMQRLYSMPATKAISH